MVFQDVLRDVVDGTEGGIASLLMDFEGIAVDSYSKPGAPFDPTRHEALMEQPNPNLKPGTVAQALTRGYALKGRTLRPASVMIVK